MISTLQRHPGQTLPETQEVVRVRTTDSANDCLIYSSNYLVLSGDCVWVCCANGSVGLQMHMCLHLTGHEHKAWSFDVHWRRCQSGPQLSHLYTIFFEHVTEQSYDGFLMLSVWCKQVCMLQSAEFIMRQAHMTVDFNVRPMHVRPCRFRRNINKKAQLTLSNPRDVKACQNCSNSTCFVSFHRIPFPQIANA